MGFCTLRDRVSAHFGIQHVQVHCPVLLRDRFSYNLNDRVVWEERGELVVCT